jgi:hypothetical protein
VDAGERKDGELVVDVDAKMDVSAADESDIVSTFGWEPRVSGRDGPGVVGAGSNDMGLGAASPTAGENCNIAPKTGEVSGVAAAESGMVLISHDRTDFGVWRCKPGLPKVGWRSRMR